MIQNMKKVAIIAMAASDNYGAVLQSFALKTAINRFDDVQADVINYRPPYMVDGYRPWLSFKIWKKEWKKYGRSYVQKKFAEHWKLRKEFRKKFREFEYFRKNFVGMKGKRYYAKSIHEIDQKYDIYIAGSDQIWNPELWEQGFDENLFLSFVSQPYIKASYAASITVDLNSRYYGSFSRLVQNFDYISIREKEHEGIVKKLSNKEVITVLDPTFLIKKEDYERVMPQKTLESDEFILFYTFNKSDNAIHYVNELAKAEHLKILHFYFGNLQKKFTSDSRCMYFTHPGEFLWYIKNAKYVITDTFHGTAFCIIFKKQFLTFESVRDMSSRVNNILDITGLNERKYSSDSTAEIHNEILWENVDIRLKEERKKAYEYLEKIIK